MIDVCRFITAQLLQSDTALDMMERSAILWFMMVCLICMFDTENKLYSLLV